MENSQPDQNPQPPVEGQQGESASPPPEQVTPPTPAHEEADRAAPQPDDEDAQVAEGDAQEPNATNDEVGDDTDVQPPADLPAESTEADPNDTHGAQDHPEG